MTLSFQRAHTKRFLSLFVLFFISILLLFFTNDLNGCSSLQSSYYEYDIVDYNLAKQNFYRFYMFDFYNTRFLVLIERDEYLSYSNFYNEQISIVTDFYFYKQLIMNGEKGLIIDVGTNSGIEAFFFSKNGYKVLSFEANREIVFRLNISQRINNVFFDLRNNVLCSTNQAYFDIKTNGIHSGSFSVIAGNSVKGVTLDEIDILEEILLYKIDIEGFEIDALLGSRQLLVKNPPRYLFIESVYNAERLYNFLNNISYMCYEYDKVDNLVYREDLLKYFDRPYTKPLSNVNILCKYK